MAEKGNSKKPFYLKKGFIILVALVALFLIGKFSQGKNKDTKNATKEPTSKIEETKNKETSDVDFSTTELTKENVKPLVEKLFNAEVKEIVFENNDLTVTFYKSSILSAKSEVKENAKKTVKFLEQIYKNPNLNEVWIYEQADVMDEKGKESIDTIITFNTNKETIKDADFENVYSLVSSDYEKLKGIAVGYTFSPAIGNELN